MIALFRPELTPSMHGAMMRVTFPAYNPYGNDKRICFKMDDNEWESLEQRFLFFLRNFDLCWDLF